MSLSIANYNSQYDVGSESDGPHRAPRLTDTTSRDRVAGSSSAKVYGRTEQAELAEAFVATESVPLEARIEEICRELGQPISQLESVLSQTIGTEGRGGRRWRPILTLAAAKLFSSPGPVNEELLNVAVAVELTHTASLVLDDMPCMDDSAERRGQPATHTQVGSAGAILLSIGLLSKAVELLGEDPRFGGDFCAEWGRMAGLAGMAGGQAMDVAASKTSLLGKQRRLHRAKSTVLPAFALWCGARSGGASVEVCEDLASFGRSLGWAYQLRDDVEDMEEDSALGKGPGGRRPLAQSQRIMRRAVSRIQRNPAIPEEGTALLLGLAAQLVEPTENRSVTNGSV